MLIDRPALTFTLVLAIVVTAATGGLAFSDGTGIDRWVIYLSVVFGSIYALFGGLAGLVAHLGFRFLRKLMA